MTTVTATRVPGGVLPIRVIHRPSTRARFMVHGTHGLVFGEWGITGSTIGWCSESQDPLTDLHRSVGDCSRLEGMQLCFAEWGTHDLP
jgi:hypothetical protein